MKHSERFALNQWLYDYPEDASYDEIMELLANGSGVWVEIGIVPWYVVEVFDPHQVADMIEDTRCAVEQMMDDLVFGIALANKTEEESKQEGAMP